MKKSKYINFSHKKNEELSKVNLVLEDSPIVVFRWRPLSGWPIEHVSKNVTLFGYTAEDLLTQEILFESLIHPQDFKRVTQEVSEYTKNNISSFTQEYRIISPTGEIFWVDDRTTIQRDDKGEVISYQGTLLDISSRKEIETALKISEQNFSELSQRLIEAQHIAHIGSWSLDLKSDTLFWSDEIFHIFGIDPQYFKANYGDFIGSVHPDDCDKVTTAYSKSLEDDTPYNIKHRIIRKSDGVTRWVHERCEHQRDDDGVVLLSQGTVQDITERVLAENDYKNLFEGTGTGMAVIERDGSLSLINNKALQTLGVEKSDIIGSLFLDWIAPEDRDRMKNYHFLRLQGKKNIPNNYEFRILEKEGTTKWALLNLTFFEDTERTLVSVVDIDEIKKTQSQLKEAISSQNAILSAIPASMFEIDANGLYLNVLAGNHQAFPVKEEELLGHYIFEVLPDSSSAQVMQAIDEAKNSGQSFGKQITMEIEDEQYWFELSVSIKNREIVPNHFIIFFHNITQMKKMEKELKHLSSYDPLTGVYNRRVLIEKLSEDIQRINRYKHSLSLFMIDIDYFKSVNDTYGHTIGDQVLKYIAKSIKACLRDTDYCARYGGEEFIVVLTNTPLEKGMEVAERLRTNIANKPIEIQECTIHTTISIGVAHYKDKDCSLDKLIERADKAMYRAKELGRNLVSIAK